MRYLFSKLGMHSYFTITESEYTWDQKRDLGLKERHSAEDPTDEVGFELNLEEVQHLA